MCRRSGADCDAVVVTSQFSAPKGVPEYLPPDSAAFLAVRQTLAGPARRAGYGYVELPVFEDTGLFVRGVGESTDVVSKEMYTFTDRGDRSLTLRPEGTAGVVRAVIEHGLDRGQLPVKLWYAGAFFRAERPQLGRYRQLQQVGVEAIGSDDPALDAEVVAIADEGFRALGLRRYQLNLTSLGCSTCRPPYRALLQQFLRGIDLDDATRERAELNPLRVLDDKREQVQSQLAGAPLMADHLCASCQEHYDTVRMHLADLQVQWQEAPRLVRGLDYYNRTTFEFSHADLGAQSGIGGGGRYDGLMASLGGQPLSGIGFGLGTDRTLLACRAESLPVGGARRCDVYLVPLGSEPKRRLVALAGRWRQAGVGVDIAYGDRGMKGALKGADRSGAPYALILGDRDLAAGTVSLKDLRDGAQETVPLDDVYDVVLARTTTARESNT
ncbi:MAG: histidine--tRNA ligase [Actinomycetota bacterium]|nr:MAG: histidine--tRNA ligase [Actinomycetota bacterium]